MTLRTHHAAGAPCWIELTTPDVEAAAVFYTGVFGWKTADVGPSAGRYQGFRCRDADVAAARVQAEVEREAGVPALWTVYLAGEADAVVERTVAAGGSVITAPVDLLAAGRMAVLADAAGAVFGVWQAGAHTSGTLVDELGSLCWSEVVADEVAVARDFYVSVFGYETELLRPLDDHDHTVLLIEGMAVAGVYRPQLHPLDAPPHWLPYIGVADVEATLLAARELGGSRATGPRDTPFGRSAVIGDPHGAHVAVMELPDEAA